MNWYDGLDCSACGKSLEATRRQGRPLLRNANGATVEPHKLPSDELVALRRTHTPICWACNLEAAFKPADASAANGAGRPNTLWWVGFPCDVCAKSLTKGWFWQERPRVVDRDARSYDIRSASREACEGPAKRYVVACTDCYHHAYGRVKGATATLPTIGAPA